MKKLLIVESPTKARTIGRMLDSSYDIKASMGHIRDLPERSLGVDLEHDFAPVYVDTPRSAKIVQELRKAADEADEIYLAPDPDREGEAIAWHLRNALAGKKNQDKFHRVTFHEITREAILNALRQRGSINQDLVDAQQARRVLDRIVGYKISPLLWSQIAKGISAGRVQSVALRLIVEREREIAAFKPQEYWVFALVLRSAAGAEFTVKLAKIDGKNFEVGDAATAEKLLDAVLSGSVPVVAKVDRSEKKRYAMPPFTTSTLQQSANTALRFSAASTMKYAQELYEGQNTGNGVVGLITYMRTDSVNIAREAQSAAAKFIEESYGKEYLPPKFNTYKSKASAQEAHEAIRPTDVRRTPDSLKPYLSEQQLKLYTMIWRRFVASQMAPCRFNQTTIDVTVSGADSREYLFRANASVVSFPGYTAAYPEREDEETRGANSNVLNSLAAGEKTAIVKADKEQKFTEPPPHYTEAGLIKTLEENGIGRPSTYATILRTIQTRRYVQHEKGKLLPTELGYKVCDFLVANLNDLFDVGFTAEMETRLDKVESGELKWTGMLHDFHAGFIRWLSAVEKPGAPAAETDALLELLGKVEFPKAVKGAKTSFDDGRFFRSVLRQRQSGKELSQKQYNALIKLAAKYRSQLPELPPELTPLIEHESSVLAERSAGAAESGVDAAGRYDGIFEAFAKVNWEKPVARRGRAFDDREFFSSLAAQAGSGRVLSPKQLAVLKRMAEKYHGELTDPEKIDAFFKITPKTGEETASESGDGEEEKELKPLFEELAKVTSWAEPVKKGRFTYDDRAFYASLLKQFESGRKLSAKQVAALKKLAGKYSGKES